MDTVTLLDLDGQEAGQVQVPSDAEHPMLIAWAMRYFVRQDNDTYREAIPFAVVTGWPADWRNTYIQRQMRNATE